MRDTALVHNPILSLPSIAGLRALPAESRATLRAVLSDISNEARIKADHCWRRHKAPMAAYWKAVAVYAKHIGRALR